MLSFLHVLWQGDIWEAHSAYVAKNRISNKYTKKGQPGKTECYLFKGPLTKLAPT